MEIESVVSQFKVKGRYLRSEPLIVGHINDTFVIATDAGQYILQRINHHIFKNIPGLTNNILLATRHIAEKIDAHPSDLLGKKLVLLETNGQQFFHKDESGNYWRMYNYVEGKSYNSIDNPGKAELAGKAFGKFQHLLADLPASQLHDTIPGFHNMKVRYEALLDAIDRNPASRVESVEAEISFVKSKVGELIVMQELIDRGIIPLRITHNDTKINNILFDKNDIPICIVDLDTVMPGSVLYDFGDAIRTATNTAAEDEADVSKIKMDVGLFEAYTKGYIATAKSFLTKSETDHLALSVRYITFIIALRFLTDYIDGDKYFKIHFPGHNLQRARAQFRLFQSMNDQHAAMVRIIDNCI